MITIDLGLNDHLRVYADGTYLFNFGPVLEDMISLAQVDLKYLSNWFQCNLLQVM